MSILMQIFTHAWARSCISPPKSSHLSAVCITQLSGFHQTHLHTPLHGLHQSGFSEMSAAHQHPSVRDLLLSLWCHMTDGAKCQFIFCCWFDIIAVSLQADLCQLFIQDIQKHEKEARGPNDQRLCQTEQGYTLRLLLENLSFKTCSSVCPSPTSRTSNGNPSPL